MPLVIPLLVPVMVLLSAVIVLGLHATENMWLRSTIEALAHPKGSIVKRIAQAPLRTLARPLLWLEKAVRSALSRLAGASLPVIGAWLGAAAVLAEHTYKTYSDAAADWTEALLHLRHKTMPREIRAKVAPVAAVAAGAAVLGRRSISEGKTLRIRTGRSIDRLNRKMGLLAGILLGIDILVKGRHATAHHHDHTHTLPRIRDKDIPRGKAKDKAHDKALTDHKARIKRLERALGLGIAAALVYRVLARVAPWLFCRNWKKIGRVVCGLNPGRVDALLALLVATLALADLQKLAHYASSVEDEAVRGLGKLLGLPDFPTDTFTRD